jgi:hypothetical protein
MRRLVLLMAIAPFAVAVGAASETVSFTSVDSQAGSGMVSYNATLAGGYTLGAIDWSGFASTINDATWGNELTLDLSGPLGAGTITLGDGTTYSPGAAFSGSSNLFAGAGDPAGTWTFDFYESYDDSGDGLADASWDYIDFLFGDFAAPEPPDATLVDVPSITTGASTSNEVEWFTFDIGATLDMDINSFGSGYDTELGLYDAAGALLADNDDTGGLQSQILATLDAGTYYVALGGYNTTYGPLWDAVGGSASGDYTLTITPEPGSLILLALGVLALRRR